ncbi:MAG: hypothetical protein JOZ72_15575 [Alphaproteobacteria bacterium]|nr:hypothetical protein [Alphaproteobacteria bacterium]
MDKEQAAGPKTELVGVSGRMQKAIEDQIAALADGLGDCLQGAREADVSDPYKNLRSSEREDAVKIVSATAELLQAIARLKGGFQHDYRIVRVEPEGGAKATAVPKQNGAKWPPPDGYDEDTYPYLTDEELLALNLDQRRAYWRMTASLPPHRRWEERLAERDAADLARLKAEVDRIAAAYPLPSENSGSNDDAGRA